MHSKDDKRTHTLMPKDKNENFHEGIKQLKEDALNTTKAKEVKL